MAAKRAVAAAKSKRVFGQPHAAAKMFRVGLYARVSHATTSRRCRYRCAPCGSMPPNAAGRSRCRSKKSVPARRSVNRARICLPPPRRREIDVVLVWRLDRGGRSLVDLVVTLKELAELGVAFVSLTEALDLTTPTGRAMAGLLSVFAEFEHEILRERIRAGIAEAGAKAKAVWAATGPCGKEGRPDPGSYTGLE